MKPPILQFFILLIVTSPVFSQNEKVIDSSVFSTLDKYLKPVWIIKKLPTPKMILNLDGPESVHGIVKHVVDEFFILENEKDKEGLKLPGMTKEYWFDKSGKLIRFKWYDLIPGEKQFLYNKAEQVNKVITTYQDKKIDSMVYKYDANGLMRDRLYYHYGSLWFKTAVNYDSISRPTVVYGMGPYNATVSAQYYYYTGSNSGPDSLKPAVADLHTFHYKNGVMIREDWIDRKTRRLSFRKEYNSKGEIIEEWSHGITKYKYTYDNKGNWITRLKIEERLMGGYSYDLVKRRVEYY